METVKVSQAPVVSEAPAEATPVAGGASLAALPSAVQDLARFFLSLSGFSSLGAVGGVAGVAASTAGSGVQLCPSASAGGAVALGAATVIPAGASGPPAAPAAVPSMSGHQQRQEASRSGRRRRRSSSGGTDRRSKKRPRGRSPSPGHSSRRREKHYRSSSDSRLWIRFSSSHCWSLLHWRHLSVFRPASTVDCCLSSLRAGDCGLLWRRRVPARVLMVACLPLLRVWRTAPSHVPLMLCASTGFPVNPGLF